MQILLTNDDGIEAEGLLALAECLQTIGKVTVVAPETCCSCCGHSVTTHRTIAFRPVGKNQYAVSGYPADCVRVAIMHLGVQPDWVLSGVNHGGNLGVDLWMSGTVAAAREAALLGYRSIAISQYRRPDVQLDWSISAERARAVFNWIRAQPEHPQRLWNVNLPALHPAEDMPVPKLAPPDCNHFEFALESTESGLQYRGNYHARPRNSGSDVDVCFSGVPSVSRLSIAGLGHPEGE